MVWGPILGAVAAAATLVVRAVMRNPVAGTRVVQDLSETRPIRWEIYCSDQWLELHILIQEGGQIHGLLVPTGEAGNKQTSIY
jgi:hypothetical protein